MEGNHEECYSNTPEKEDFSISGPHHLTRVDWGSMDDRRAIAASLVQGVYVLERDRLNNRKGKKALAPKWWDYFQFQLIETLQDERGGSIFASIFEYKECSSTTTQGPPRYVLAFRGTMKKLETLFNDLRLDFRVAFHRTLIKDLRYKMGLKALEELVSIVGSPSIWMVGHSLGAILALRVGKTMAGKGSCIESYLFNPPFPSVPSEQIQKEAIKKAFQVIGNIVIAVASVAIKNESSLREDYDSFIGLNTWIPHLFVHPCDWICSGYIGYFENRQLMKAIGLGRMNNVAISSSALNLFAEAMGRGGEATHLIPSAHVTKNMQSNMNLAKAHGLEQWWQQQCDFHSKQHQLDGSQTPSMPFICKLKKLLW